MCICVEIHPLSPPHQLLRLPPPLVGMLEVNMWLWRSLCCVRGTAYFVNARCKCTVSPLGCDAGLPPMNMFCPDMPLRHPHCRHCFRHCVPARHAKTVRNKGERLRSGLPINAESLGAKLRACGDSHGGGGGGLVLAALLGPRQLAREVAGAASKATGCLVKRPRLPSFFRYCVAEKA